VLPFFPPTRRTGSLVLFAFVTAGLSLGAAAAAVASPDPAIVVAKVSTSVLTTNHRVSLSSRPPVTRT
jgi:hypothetical protein